MSASGASPSTSASTPAPVTASAFLANEEVLARKAMKNTLTELKDTITGAWSGPASAGGAGDAAKGAGDKAKEAFNEHPYLALLGATAAGFLTAAAVVPSKEQQVLKKLAALERAVALQGGDVAHPKPGGNTLAGSLVNALAGVIKPVLLHTVTAALAAQQAAQTVAPDEAAAAEAAVQNGHGPEQPN